MDTFCNQGDVISRLACRSVLGRREGNSVQQVKLGVKKMQKNVADQTHKGRS